MSLKRGLAFDAPATAGGKPSASTQPDGRIRVSYFPTAESAVLSDFESAAEYDAAWIDPITGQPWPSDSIRSDSSGEARVDARCYASAWERTRGTLCVSRV